MPGPRGRGELVQCVDEHDHAALCGGPAQQFGEGLLDVLGGGGIVQRRSDPQVIGQLLDPAAKHVVDLAGAGADAGGMGEQEHVGRFPQLAVKVGEQGALAGPGLAGDAQTPIGLVGAR